MKKKIVYFLLMLSLVVLQTSFVPNFCAGYFFVDIVLVGAMAWSFADGFAPFLPWAITLGILQDIFSHSVVGAHVLVIVLSTYVLSFFSKRFSMEIKGTGVLILSLLVAVGSFLPHLFLGFFYAGKISLPVESLTFSFPGSISLLVQISANIVFFFLFLRFVKKMKKYYSLE